MFWSLGYRKILWNAQSKNVKTMSSPQEFDSTKYGMGKSKALYFYDPDGNILEAITPID